MNKNGFILILITDVSSEIMLCQQKGYIMNKPRFFPGGFSALMVIVQTLFFSSGAQTISNSHFSINIGSHGEISSFQITGDMYPTNYVMNATNSPDQNTSDHQWVGELLFTYRVGSGNWIEASTNRSADVRHKSQNGNQITVTYNNSANSDGIRNFELTERYSLVEDYVLWEITLKNTGNQDIVFADIGLPLPFNEKWLQSNDVIYETRTLAHSHVAQNSSYMRITRPSGRGKFLLMIPDASTGAGFEYRDVWEGTHHPGSAWAIDTAGRSNWRDRYKYPKGLHVYYIHSDRIKSLGRGYLPNTSLTLSPGLSKTYAFKFFAVENEQAMRETIYKEGLVDVTVVPGMIVSTDMTVKAALRTTKTINSVTAEFPGETTVSPGEAKSGDYHIYQLKFSRLGPNDIVVNYGENEKTTLQFNVIEPPGAAIQRHSTFLVEKQQWNSPGMLQDKVFDDWLMEKKQKRNVFNGYWGWGDDWGYVKGLFLAWKNVYNPVISEINAVDQYLETAIWNRLMRNTHNSYLIYDFLMPEPNTTPTYRGYAYPHIYNTYFAMYQIAKLHSDIVQTIHPPQTYLLRCYNILNAQYGQGVAYNWDTGVMGEQTTPEIIAALQAEGLTTQANRVIEIMRTKYNNFRNNPYPFGSEYSYDNTGEEAIYTLAKMNNNTDMMRQINTKTRACRGNFPLWYYYGVPITICGEAWWQFQYTVALAGYAMNDWMLNYSSNPELDARLAYAAKIANLAHINSGQINSDQDNLGAAAWTYQAALGPNYIGTVQMNDVGKLQNGWRNLDGEAQLGFWGAIRILSADVVDDPVFGLYGYGCDIERSGSNFAITPKDGICKRLNMVSKKFSVVLDQDQYTRAVIGEDNDYIELTLRNLKRTAHKTNIRIKGLFPASYNVIVDGQVQNTFNASAGEVSKVSIQTGTSESYNVKIKNSSTGVLNLPRTRNFSISRSGNGFIIRGPLEAAGNVSLRIFNVKGEIVAEIMDVSNGKIFWSAQSGGTYVARLMSGSKVLVTGKFMDIR